MRSSKLVIAATVSLVLILPGCAPMMLGVQGLAMLGASNSVNAKAELCAKNAESKKSAAEKRAFEYRNHCNKS